MDIATVIGLVLGLFIGALLAFPLAFLPEPFSQILPFVGVVFFGYLGIAMGVLFRRGEKLVSLALSIGIAIVYYIFLLAGEPLGKQGKLSPFVAMWAANIFFSILALFLMWKAVTESSIGIPGWLRRPFTSTRLAAIFSRGRP